jgi:hypothetical protein
MDTTEHDAQESLNALRSAIRQTTEMMRNMARTMADVDERLHGKGNREAVNRSPAFSDRVSGSFGSQQG